MSESKNNSNQKDFCLTPGFIFHGWKDLTSRNYKTEKQWNYLQDRVIKHGQKNKPCFYTGSERLIKVYHESQTKPLDDLSLFKRAKHEFFKRFVYHQDTSRWLNYNGKGEPRTVLPYESEDPEWYNEALVKKHLLGKKTIGTHAHRDISDKSGGKGILKNYPAKSWWSDIDLDLHLHTGGNLEIFKLQFNALLEYYWKKNHSQLVVNEDSTLNGVHLLQYYDVLQPLEDIRSNVRRELDEIHEMNPEIAAKVDEWNARLKKCTNGRWKVKQIKDLELYPSVSNGVKLIGARGKVVLADKVIGYSDQVWGTLTTRRTKKNPDKKIVTTALNGFDLVSWWKSLNTDERMPRDQVIDFVHSRLPDVSNQFDVANAPQVDSPRTLACVAHSIPSSVDNLDLPVCLSETISLSNINNVSCVDCLNSSLCSFFNQEDLLERKPSTGKPTETPDRCNETSKSASNDSELPLSFKKEKEEKVLLNIVSGFENKNEIENNKEVKNIYKNRTKKLLTEFWKGTDNPIGILDKILLTTVTFLRHEGLNQEQAHQLIHQYISDLPTEALNCSFRLLPEKHGELCRNINDIVKTAYRSKINDSIKKSLAAWKRCGFLVSDKLTWNNHSKIPEIVWTDEDKQAFKQYLQPVLKPKKWILENDPDIAVTIATAIVKLTIIKEREESGWGYDYLPSWLEPTFGIKCKDNTKLSLIFKTLIELKIIKKRIEPHPGFATCWALGARAFARLEGNTGSFDEKVEINKEAETLLATVKPVPCVNTEYEPVSDSMIESWNEGTARFLENEKKMELYLARSLEI